MSLFEKYGGFAKIHPVVMDFYDRLLDNDELGPYFDDIDMKRLIDHQTKFVSSLLGGPADIDDQRLHVAHRSLNVSPAHFDEMLRVLKDTVTDAGFDPEDVQAVADAVEAKRALVVAP
jgi:hemoglobin